MSALEQNWHVATARRALHTAHILPTTPRDNQGAMASLCGERHRTWLPLAEVSTLAEGPAPEHCRRCVRRWRDTRPVRSDGLEIPAKYRTQFELYLAALAATSLSTSARRNYASSAAAFLRWAAAAGITPARWGSAPTAAQYAQTLTDMSPATINVRMLAITDLCRRLNNRMVQPTPRVRAEPDPARVLSAPERLGIIDAARDRSLVAELIITLLLRSGAKPGQILALDDRHWQVDGESVRITVNPHNDVTVPLSGHLAEHLQNGEHLVRTGTGAPMSPRRLRQLLVEIGEEAGVEQLNASAFRDTWLADRLLSGADDETIRRQLGVRKLRPEPVWAEIEHRRQVERDQLEALPDRRHRVTKSAGVQLLGAAAERWWPLRRDAGGQIPDDAGPELELELKVLRQILHPERLDLSTYVDQHGNDLVELHRRHLAGGLTWLTDRPVALYLLAAGTAPGRQFAEELLAQQNLISQGH